MDAMPASPSVPRNQPITLGLLAIVAVVAIDQAVKFWLLSGLDLETRGVMRLLPFLDLVPVWNTGISYGLFPQNGPVGRWMLLGVKAVAVVLLAIWLSRAGTRLTAISLGLIIGGAIGNAIDRVTFGAVFDFVLLHISTASFSFRWYVFNLADVAIVAGVFGLLYEAVMPGDAVKAP
jgi:signal peptidase II